MRIPFVGPAYKTASVNVSAQRCVNLYLETTEQGGKVPAALYPTPGLVIKATLGDGPHRAQYPFGDYDYVVSGAGVYRVATDYSNTLLGSIGTSSGFVSMACNGTQIGIVDGSKGYIVTLATGAIAQITAEGFPNGVTWIRYIDGYFVVGGDGTQKFQISAINDGFTWNALDFASAEGDPDPLIAGEVDHRELWLFGTDSVEIWYDTGNSDFPFERTGNAFLEMGCAAVGSVAKLDNSIFWLGKDRRGDGIVWRADGYRPVRVSDHGIEQAILSYDTISDAVAYTYQERGHAFYVLSFPSADATWVYDASTQCWHERTWFNAQSGRMHRHRGITHSMFGRDHLVGDWQNGNLYKLDQAYYADQISLGISCAYPLTDDGTLAATAGFGNLPTISPAKQAFTYEMTSTVKTLAAVSAGALSNSGTFPIPAVDQCFEYRFDAAPAGDFSTIFGCGVLWQVGGVFGGTFALNLRRVAGQLQIAPSSGSPVNVSGSPVGLRVLIYIQPTGRICWMLNGADQGWTGVTIPSGRRWAPYEFVNDGTSVGEVVAGTLFTAAGDIQNYPSDTAIDLCGNVLKNPVSTALTSPIKRLRSSYGQDSENQRVFYQSFEVDFQAGGGLATGQGSDPKFMLRWSDDGGHTWSNIKYLPMGKIGKYGQRAKREQCGAGRNRVWELSCTDPVNVVILGAMVRAQVGNS